jgi:hypothetical protein
MEKITMSNTLVAKATAALETSVGSILGCDDSDEVKRFALAESFAQFESYLQRNVVGSDIAKVDRGDTGYHNLAARVVEHMIDRLGHERQRHGFEKKESSQMESIEKLKAARVEKLEQLAKSSGVVAVAKHVLAEGTSGLTPADFNRMCNTDWQRDRRSGESYDQCFARHYSAPDAMDVRKADQMLKSMPLNVTPVMVGGVAATHEAVNNTEQSEAYQQLVDMGEKLRESAPFLSAGQAFARASEQRPDLLAKAHKRPGPTTSYEFPR